MADDTLGERFWSKVDKAEGCWEWTAYRNKGGYGTYRLNPGKMQLAHRVAFLDTGEAIPEGTELDHLCRNRACVRPDHLQAVTRRTNIARGESRVARQMAQTTCIRGHAYDVANSYTDGRGKRVCRTCVRRKIREQRARGIRYDEKK